MDDGGLEWEPPFATYLLRLLPLPRVHWQVIRNNDLMRRAGQKELEVLRAIATADPDGR